MILYPLIDLEGLQNKRNRIIQTLIKTIDEKRNYMI